MVVALLLLAVIVYATVRALRRPPPNEHTRWYGVPTYQRQKRPSERWMIVRVDEGDTPPVERSAGGPRV
jgi:hypothetical protein